MKYLLDTNIIVNHLRKKKIIEEEIIKAGASISIITLAELFCGAYKSNNPSKSFAIIEQIISMLNLEILNLNEQVVAKFGSFKAELEMKGVRLEDFDLLIGATADANNLILKTENKRHFQRIKGLKVE